MEYIPLFINSKNELEYELTVTCLIGELCDTHAILIDGGDQIDSIRGNKQVPVRIQFIEDRWIITGYYLDPAIPILEKTKKTGLKVGDIITHINNKPIELIIDSVKKYYPASNEAVQMRDIANDLLRSNENTMNINYISSNQSKQKLISLEKRNNLYQYMFAKDTSKCYRFITNDIGCITLESVKPEDIPIIRKKFQNTKGIILDIRNYPSENIVYALSSYFVSRPTPFSKVTMSNINKPGEFSFTSTLEIPKIEDEFYQGKLIIIVNEETQSAAEFAAMAFQTGKNVITIGSQTAGADGNCSQIKLPGGLTTMISGIGIYYPSNQETQRVGIALDIEVRPTIKGILEKRDELIENAIELIEGEW